MDPEGKRKQPTPPSKTYTELDADPIKLFPGAIDLMNPQNPCPRCCLPGRPWKLGVIQISSMMRKVCMAGTFLPSTFGGNGRKGRSKAC